MCIRCRKGGKEPSEKKVTYHSCASSYILEWIHSGGNVGVTSLTGYAVFIDGDTEEIRAVIENWVDTLWWNTGKPGHREYALFLEDSPLKRSVPLVDGGYIKTQRGYVIIPPSVHPNGRRYGGNINDVPIAVIKESEFVGKLKPYYKREQIWNGGDKVNYHRLRNGVGRLSLKEMISLSGFRRSGARFQGAHPIHGSESGSNFVVDIAIELWHCFSCGTGGSILEWVAVSEGTLDCSQVVPAVIRGEKFWAIVASAHDKYGLDFMDVAMILSRGDEA